MKKLLIILLTFSLSFTALSQDIDAFLEGGVDNANTLLGNYLEPAFQGIGYGLNSGWYNTGKPHKSFGIDLTMSVNMASIPSDAEFFTFNASDYTDITLDPSINGNTSDQLPTLFGPNLDADDIPFLVFNAGTADEVAITSPTGLGMDEALPFNAVPTPMVQIGIGIVKGTEIKLRLIPEQTFGDPGEEFSTSLFGLGIMHDVKQWIPGLKAMPFDLSGFVGFTNFKNSGQLNADAPDQIVELDVSGTTVQGIISKKIAVATFYGGLGFISTKSNFRMLGDYEVDGVPADPIDLEFTSSSPRMNLGARLKLAVFTFHVEYAIQKYNTLTAGFGISVR